MALSWSDVGKTLAGIAPIVGTALGGPAGALVGGMVAKALGTDATPDAVTTAIASDPTNAAKILALQNEHEETLNRMQLDYATAIVNAQGGVVKAEASSSSWLAANWRPILMLSFTAIIVVNYLVVPIAGWFGLRVAPLVLPPDLWTLLKIGVGGYVLGRSGEKIATSMRS